MPEETITPPPAPDAKLAILTPPELLRLKASGAEGIRRTRYPFAGGGSFDVTTLRKPEGLALVVVCAEPAKKLTEEQRATIAEAHTAEAAKLAQKIKAEPK